MFYSRNWICLTRASCSHLSQTGGKGLFVSFDFTLDAETEIRAFFCREGREIVLVRVARILRRGRSRSA